MIAKKISLLGSFAVGKTSLVARFVHSMYTDAYHTTVGVKVDKKELPVGEEIVKLMIWDIAGKDEFFKPPDSYLKGSAGFLLVVDGTRVSTVAVAQELWSQVRTVVGEIPLVLLINKCDLIAEWEVEDSALEPFQEAGVKIIKTSAKTGEQVEEAFEALARMMIET